MASDTHEVVADYSGPCPEGSQIVPTASALVMIGLVAATLHRRHRGNWDYPPHAEKVVVNR